jgi:hypothetical protein
MNTSQVLNGSLFITRNANKGNGKECDSMRWQQTALGTAVEKNAFHVLLEIERRLREEERKNPRSQRGRAHQNLLKIGKKQFEQG